METQRQSKVGRLIQRELSEIFQRDCQPLCGGKMVTVTKVRVSPDLSSAKAYLSLFPTSGIEEVVEKLNKETSQVRFALTKRVAKQLRIMPHLKFFLDDSLDYIENIVSLLKK
jgi:ribosome-binding factor A